MKLTKRNSPASFNPSLLNVLFITILTWAPLISVIVPAFLHGGINEEAFGTGSRYYRSPHAYFTIMTLGTLVFLYISFIPMCLSFVRGYFVKFSESTVYFKHKKFDVSDIKKIESFNQFGKNYKFILKNGETVVLPTGINRNISDYVENRFHSIITS